MIINIVVIFIIILVGYQFIEIETQVTNRKKYIFQSNFNRSIKTKLFSKYLNHSENNRKKYIIIVVIIYILQSGLRHVAVGADTYSYYLHFEKVKSLEWGKIYSVLINHYSTGEGKDPGYLVFQKVAQYITPYYQLYLFLIAIIFFFALGYFLFKNTNKISDLIFAFVLYSCLFYSFFSITGHRQTIATAGILWSYEYIKKREIIPFFIIVFIASTIHKSCLIFIPFYFLAPMKRVNLLFWSITLFPIFFVLSSRITMHIQSLSNDYNEYRHFENLQPITFTVMMVLIGISALYLYKHSLKRNPKSIHYFNAFALAVFFTSLVFSVQGYMRIVQYFSIFMLLLIPQVLKTIENKQYKSRELIFSFCVLLLIAMSIKANWNAEYKFFWQQMKLGNNYKNTNYYYKY